MNCHKLCVCILNGAYPRGIYLSNTIPCYSIILAFFRLKVRYSTLLLTSTILLILYSLCAWRQFYIAPSPDLCPGGEDAAINGHCLTIEQFAASADLTLSCNVILELVPGNHTLESELFIAEDITDFVMRSTNASVLCSGANANITLETFASVV